MVRLGFVPLVIFVAIACQGSPTFGPTPSQTQRPNVETIDARTFTKFGGCGDAYLWATNAEGTTAITVDWQGAATGAWEDGPFDETASLAEAPVQVSLVAGNGLDALYCNDILTPGMSEDNKIAAHEGTVRLVVRPDEGGFKPASHANATLNDLRFDVIVGTDQETWHLDDLTFNNVSVGWFAG